jgi:hypothetical protein
LNPALGPDDVETVALFINSSIEGTTMLLGYKKPWEAKMPQIKAIAVKSLIHLAKTVTSEEIHSLHPSKAVVRTASSSLLNTRRRKSSARAM